MNSATAIVAMPARSQARKLIIASLALIGCRVVSEWDNVLAGSAALVILAILAASIIAGMPRVRRCVLLVALPATTLANAVVFGLGAFVMFLAMQGLLDDGRIGNGPSWSSAFALVPLAAAVNLISLAWPRSAPRWPWSAWLANLASACYAVWHWRRDDPIEMVFAVPVAATALMGLAILSSATIAWDNRNQESAQPDRARRLRRRRRVLGAAASVVCLIWLALVPVYHNRLVARALDAFGLWANFGVALPGWKLPFELPFEWYRYVGEVSGAAAPETLQGDAGEAGRLLSTLPWLDFIQVNDLPSGGARILQPLAGHRLLRQIALKGAGVTDETLADAARIPALNSIVFERARITDEGLANLADAQWLQRLLIRQTPIPGEGLVHLSSLPRLTELDLSGTNVGDRQLGVLPQFKMLLRLALNDTRISDRGLPALAQCRTLRFVDLSGTRVTASGVERLQQALPACKILWTSAADER